MYSIAISLLFSTSTSVLGSTKAVLKFAHMSSAKNRRMKSSAIAAPMVTLGSKAIPMGTITTEKRISTSMTPSQTILSRPWGLNRYLLRA
jgi:hypothetical protein